MGFDGPLNKDRVKKSIKHVCGKYGTLTSMAHNMFAIPVLAPTIGILNWTKQGIQHPDADTRKIMTYTGSLHKRSDTSQIYVPRKQGGRGLTSVEDTFISRVIALEKHIQQEAPNSPILKKVKEHEQQNVVRLIMEFKQELGTVTSAWRSNF